MREWFVRYVVTFNILNTNDQIIVRSKVRFVKFLDFRNNHIDVTITMTPVVFFFVCF